MHECDTGNFQIHGANPNAIASKFSKKVRSRGIPLKDLPGGKESNSLVQTRIGRNLLVGVTKSVDFREPTAELFFQGDDGGRYLITGCVQSLEQFQTRWGRITEDRDVICVKNQQSLFRKFAVFDTLGRAVPRHDSGRHFAMCRQCCANPF